MKRTLKNKLLAYGVLPVVALSLIGAGTASAHGMWGGKNITPEELATRQSEMFSEEASLLGINIDEVKNAWAAGKSLEELAQEKGITPEQLKQKMADLKKQQMQTQLKALVDKGVITQAQADQRLAFLNKQQTNIGAHAKNGAKHGRFGGGRMMMGL